MRAKLRLFVTGHSAQSARAIKNLEEALAHRLEGCDFEVIDVLERLDVAEAYDVLATPTLVRVEPKPSRRVTGDLSDAEAVIEALGLSGS